MNILLVNGLPEEFNGVPLSADFRNMIQVNMLLQDTALNPAEKTFAALNQLYANLPEDIDAAIEGLTWFYGRGKTDGGTKIAKKTTRKAFDFDQDAELIYAAFYATYGISLTTVDFLHWWEFMALFEGLPETTLIKRVMYWRTADTAQMTNEERLHVLQMRNEFALKRQCEPMKIGDDGESLKEKVARRFAEARAAVGAGEK